MNAASVTAAATLASAAFILLAWAGRWAVKLLIRTYHFLDDWGGQPARAGIPERPGVMARLANVEEAVEHIKAETRPNGGHSLRDRLDDTAHAVAEVRDSVTRLTGRVELFEQQRKHRETGDTG